MQLQTAMDKACITAVAAHKQMLLLSNAAGGSSSSTGGFSMLREANVNISPWAADRDAAAAAKCEMISVRGFQPLDNVMSLKEW